MAGSTVSISNQVSTARRRAVEKNTPIGVPDIAVAALADSDAPNVTGVDAEVAVLRDGRKAAPQIPARKSNPTRKSSKPRWLTVVSILSKNIALLAVILGLIQMSRWIVLNYGRESEGFAVISGDFDGKFAEVQKFVKTTMKAMQVQVSAIDKKIDDGVSSVRKEFHDTIEKKGEEMELKLKALDVRNDALQKFVDEFPKKSLLSKEEFAEFFEEFKKSTEDKAQELSLDEIKDYARQIVEEEIERHAADGLGMVDYALSSGGGKVVKHSEAYGTGKFSKLITPNSVGSEAQKMLMPSFGEPGNCFPLKGDRGFVEISLRTAIVPQAVTLEHVARTVAYDRSSAPKHCRVFGWMRGPYLSGVIYPDNVFLLAEFTYDLEKSNAQTFKVLDTAPSMLIDTVKFEFASNHGTASHTCIYRLRVHGHEPTSAPVFEIQP